MKKVSITYLWKDRKRVLGMPLSFTRYRLSEDRIFLEVGFFNMKQEEQNRLAKYKLLWPSQLCLNQRGNNTAFWDTNASRKPGLPRSRYAIGSASEKYKRPRVKLREVTTEAF